MLMMPTLSPLSNALRKVVGAVLILALTAPTSAWALRNEQLRNTPQRLVGLEQAIGGTLSDLEVGLAEVQKQILDAFHRELFEYPEGTADLILISAGTREMAQYYSDHYEMLRGVLFRDDVPILCIADPDGTRVEPGGAVGHGLREAKRLWKKVLRDPRYEWLNGHQLDQLRIVVIQAGGFGTRFTSAMARGTKTLMPIGAVIPSQEVSRPVMIDQLLTPMDAALMGAYQLTQVLQQRGQAGLVVLNGDGLLVTEPNIMDGISVFTNPASIDEADKKYGIVVADPVTRVIKAFDEKPSKQQIKEKIREGHKAKNPLRSHLDPDDETLRQLDTSTGSWVGTHSDPQTYQRFFRALLETADVMWERIQHDDPAHPVYGIDIAQDFFIPLTIDEPTYLNQRVFGKLGLTQPLPQHQLNALMAGDDLIGVAVRGRATSSLNLTAKEYQDRLRFYRDLYRLVRDHFLPLYAPKQHPDRTMYLDLGDNATWYRFITGGHVLSRIFGRRLRVNSVEMPGAVIDDSAIVYNSTADLSATVGASSVIYESELLPGTVVGKESVVYSTWGTTLTIGDQQLVVQIPVEGKGRATIYTGRDDRLTEPVGKATLFGRPALEVLQGWRTNDGRSVLDVLGIPRKGLAERSMKDLRIWPVTHQQRINGGLFTWMATRGQRAPDAYLSGAHMTYGEVIEDVDYDQLRIRDALGPEGRFRRQLQRGTIPENPQPYLEELYRADWTLVHRMAAFAPLQLLGNVAPYPHHEDGSFSESPYLELVAKLPDRFEGNHKLLDLYGDLSQTIPKDVLIRNRPNSYGIVIARFRNHPGDSQKPLLEALDEITKHYGAFPIHLRDVGMTFKREVVVRGFVATPTLYQIQREAVTRVPSALPLVTDDGGRQQSVHLNLKIARAEKEPTPAQVRSLEEVSRGYQGEEGDFGQYLVQTLVLVNGSREEALFELGRGWRRVATGLEEAPSERPEDYFTIYQREVGKPRVVLTVPVDADTVERLRQQGMTVYALKSEKEPLASLGEEGLRRLLITVKPNIIGAFVNERFSAETLRALAPGLKLIAFMGRGVPMDQAAKQAAAGLGIHITSLGGQPEDNLLRQATAEMAEALALERWFHLQEWIESRRDETPAGRTLENILSRRELTETIQQQQTIADFLWAQLLRQMKRLDDGRAMVLKDQFRGAGNGSARANRHHQLSNGPTGVDVRTKIGFVGSRQMILRWAALAHAHDVFEIFYTGDPLTREVELQYSLTHVKTAGELVTDVDYVLRGPGEDSPEVPSVTRPYAWLVDPRGLAVRSDADVQALTDLLSIPLSRLTIGFFGLGDIGSTAASYLKAFGFADMVAYKRSGVTRDEASEARYVQLAEQLPIRYVDAEETLWAQADLVISALPDAPETRRMFGPEQIRLMVPDANHETPHQKVVAVVGRGTFLARPGEERLHDEKALIEALRQHPGILLATDVLPNEALPKTEQPLILAMEEGLPILVTPHQASDAGDPQGHSVRVAMENVMVGNIEAFIAERSRARQAVLAELEAKRVANEPAEVVIERVAMRDRTTVAGAHVRYRSPAGDIGGFIPLPRVFRDPERTVSIEAKQAWIESHRDQMMRAMVDSTNGKPDSEYPVSFVLDLPPPVELINGHELSWFRAMAWHRVPQWQDESHEARAELLRWCAEHVTAAPTSLKAFELLRDVAMAPEEDDATRAWAAKGLARLKNAYPRLQGEFNRTMKMMTKLAPDQADIRQALEALSAEMRLGRGAAPADPAPETGLEEGRTPHASVQEIVRVIGEVLTQQGGPTSRLWNWEQAMTVVRPALKASYSSEDLERGLQALGLSSSDQSRRAFLRTGLYATLGTATAVMLPRVIRWPAVSTPLQQTMVQPGRQAPAAPPVPWQEVLAGLTRLENASNPDAPDRMLRLIADDWSSDQRWASVDVAGRERLAQALAGRRLDRAAAFQAIAERVSGLRVEPILKLLDETGVPWEPVVGQLLKETADFQVRAHLANDGHGLLQINRTTLRHLWARALDHGLVQGDILRTTPEHLSRLLFNSTRNIQLGVLYVQELLERLERTGVHDAHERMKLALYIYNRGDALVLGVGDFPGVLREVIDDGQEPTYDHVRDRLKQRYVDRPVIWHDGEGNPHRTLLTREGFGIGTDYVETIGTMIGLFRLLEAPRAGLEQPRKTVLGVQA